MTRLVWWDRAAMKLVLTARRKVYIERGRCHSWYRLNRIYRYLQYQWESQGDYQRGKVV